MKGMGEAMTCSMCFEVFQARVCEPLVLPCGHTFCRSCLNTVKQTGNFSCPTCRESHNNVQVEKLPVNYSLLSLLDAYQGLTFKNCSEHGDNLQYWCCGCELPLCSLCLYSGHPQRHSVKLITAYVQERKVALEAEIKLQQQIITVQQKEVWNRFEKLVPEIKKFRGNSFTLHNHQVSLNQLLSNVRNANSIDSIKHVENKIKEYSPMVMFGKCEAKSSSSTEDAVNETIKIQSTSQDTERREDTFGASKRDDTDNADDSDTAGKNNTAGTSKDMQSSSGIDGPRAVLNCQEGRLLLQYVSHPTESHISLQMPSEVFLELCAGDQCFGRVYIRLWCHLRRAQQFMALCLSTFATSHCGTPATNVINKNSNGERINFGSISNMIDFNELEWGGKYSKTIKAGHILASKDGQQLNNHVPTFGHQANIFSSSRRIPVPQDNSQSHGFSICTREPQDNSMGTPFGEVTSGLDVVKAAAAHNPVTQVKISCCGLVVPEFVL